MLPFQDETVDGEVLPNVSGPAPTSLTFNARNEDQKGTSGVSFSDSDVNTFCRKIMAYNLLLLGFSLFFLVYKTTEMSFYYIIIYIFGICIVRIGIATSFFFQNKICIQIVHHNLSNIGLIASCVKQRQQLHFILKPLVPS